MLQGLGNPVQKQAPMQVKDLSLPVRRLGLRQAPLQPLPLLILGRCSRCGPVLLLLRRPLVPPRPLRPHLRRSRLPLHHQQRGTADRPFQRPLLLLLPLPGPTVPRQRPRAPGYTPAPAPARSARQPAGASALNRYRPWPRPYGIQEASEPRRRLQRVLWGHPWAT